MTERPILFTPGNVRAILDGTKTQTRRIVKLPAAPNHLGTWEPTTVGGPEGGLTKNGGSLPEMLALWHTRTGLCITCPFGVPGDRLWVREGLCKSPGGLVQYRRDLKVVGWAEWEWQRLTLSPIHMPRKFARFWLEITDVRIQRLQEISEEDAIGEGVTIKQDARIAALVAKDMPGRMEYWALWESIHGKGSWEMNPWVWAITFKQVKA